MNDNDPVQHLGEAVASLEDLLLHNDLSPDPERRNWAAFRRELDALESRATEVTASLGPAWLFADHDLRASIASRCAATLLDAAVLLRLAGRDARGKTLLDRAADLARDGNAKDVLRAIDQAVQHPDLAAGACYHRWLDATGRLPDPEPRRRSLPPKAPDIESPVARPPSLIRINGCGVGLYGHRDQKPDGSYLSAWCVSILFIPVFPICWYRVVASEKGYVFRGRRTLGFAGRLWQFSIAMTLMASVLAWNKLGNPWGGAADAKAELGRLSAIEADGGGANEEVLEGYLRVAQEHADETEGRAAAYQAAKLIAARIPAPCKLESVEDVRRQALRITPVPASARTEKADRLLRDALLRCASQLPSNTLAEAEVLGIAIATAVDEQQKGLLRARRRESLAAVAASIREQHPLHALALYRSMLPEPKAMDGMVQVFESLSVAPSTIAAAGPAMQAWMNHAASDPRHQPRVQGIRDKLAAGEQQHASYLEQIDAASDSELERLFKSDDNVEEVAVAYARQRRSAGSPSQGIAAITKLNPDGRLTYESRIELAWCYRDAKNLDQARLTLRAVIDELSMPYREAVERWRDLKRTEWDRLAEEARRRRGLAKDVDLPEEAAQSIEKALADSPQLKAAAEEVDGPSIVVRAVVALASIDLAQGIVAEGEERSRLLHDAEATLLQMKAAEGDFDYELQSGVVLHRVRKTQEAEAAFSRALQGADSGQMLKVSGAYRSIGMQKKARQLAESAYHSASDDSSKWQAASARAVLWLSLDDRKEWLERCEPQSSRLDRLEVEAELALRRGADQEAARILAQVCKEYEPRISNDATDANNGGLAFLRLYEVTGDLAHLQKAVRALSRAAVLGPDRPIVLDNYADVLELLGSSEVLGKWIHVRALRLDSAMTRDALELLADSKLSDEVIDAMLANRSLLLSQQIREQYSVLAPHDGSALLKRLTWARRGGDTPLVDTLVAQLQSLSAQKPSAPPDEVSASDAGESDAGESDAGARLVEGSEDSDERRALDRARKDGHAPTVAAVSLLLADHLRSLNRRHPDPARGAESAQLAHEAIKDWPALRTTDAAIQGLIEAALVSHMHRAPAIGRALRLDSSTTVWLHDALGGDGAKQVRDALRADKDFLAAAETVRSFKSAGAVLGWELSRVLDDAGWKRRAAAGASEGDYRVTEAYARQRPDGVDARFVEILKQARGEAPTSASAAPSSSASPPASGRPSAGRGNRE